MIEISLIALIILMIFIEKTHRHNWVKIYTSMSIDQTKEYDEFRCRKCGKTKRKYIYD